MQNASSLRLNLLSYRQLNRITLYSIQIQLPNETLLWEARYSVLKQACQDFPHCSVKFPPKSSIRHVLSQISGDEGFLLERFNFMKEYFDAVSSNPELRFNKAFMQIYRHLQQEKTKNEHENGKTVDEESGEMRAPVIKGRKLSTKNEIEGPLYVVN